MYEKVNYIAGILNSIAEELDIPESKYLEAKNRYEAVGNWLGEEGTVLSTYYPEIYTQGSFRLGTVVKPIKKDEYDIDLVCFLNELRKDDTTQANLKKMVGDRLKENTKYNNILDKEGRRCWTLDYANEFHMDILPSIADNELRAKDILHKNSILITDKKKIENGDVDWPKSNPKGYATWFLAKQADIFQTFKKEIAESIKANIEDVPDYKVRTPLQRAIQILKRHRDVFFLNNNKGNKGNKPISIIITTLSANLYSGQDNVFNAIYDILSNLNKEMLIREEQYYIPNPTNLEENFADKWNENPELSKAFFNWVNNAKNFFCDNVLLKKDVKEISKVLNESLGSYVGKIASQNIKTTPVYIKTNNIKKTQPWQYK
jgi:hypothetical protein